jgi:hypothetical protein
MDINVGEQVRKDDTRQDGICTKMKHMGTNIPTMKL